MKAPAFAYARPQSLAETFELLERYGEDARLLAGGQSLIATLNMRLAAPRVLVDINGLPQLAGIKVHGGVVTIGALTRHRQMESSSEIAERVPLLHQAMPHVAHAAIRNRGTFGGSVCFADPAAELPACSVALGARFRIASKRGERSVAACDFFKGLYEIALEPGEVLVAGEFPVILPGWCSAFQELARRHGDYAIVGLAAHARLASGVLSDTSLAFFGVGATPVLARKVAMMLEGRPLVPAMVARAQAALDTDLAPFADAQTSGATKLHLARVLLGRVIAQLAEG